MLPLRYARRWRAAGVALLVAVLAAAMVPAVWLWPARSDFATWIAHADKWAHGLTFAFLAIWFAGQYRRRAYWIIGPGLLGFGMLIEACQRFVSYRSADWLDVAADFGGIVFGLAVALAGLGGWTTWVEDRLIGNTVPSGGE